MAVALSRPQSFISKYERGDRRPDFTEFVEIAEVLRIDMTEFLADCQSDTLHRDIGRLLEKKSQRSD